MEPAVDSEEPAVTTIATAELKTLQEAAAQAAQFKDQYLRALADLDNYRKRAAREKDDAIKFANESFVSDLLPAVDSFDLGLEFAKTAPDAKAVADGMGMAVSQLQNLLRQMGVDSIDAVGQPFDPHQHEAISHQETSEHAEGTVIQQLRRGYKFKDRLLRPASVVVAKGPATDPADQPTPDASASVA